MTAGAPYRYQKTLRFRPADPKRDIGALISFGRDLYIASLGDERQFQLDYGPYGEKFPIWIKSCGAVDPGFAALLEEDGVAIGMVVLGRDRRARPLRYGQVHHFYIVPEKRGRGFGGLLDDYARETLAVAGCHRARLNVTARNKRAIRFYEAQGWQEVMPRKSSALRFLEVAL